MGGWTPVADCREKRRKQGGRDEGSSAILEGKRARLFGKTAKSYRNSVGFYQRFFDSSLEVSVNRIAADLADAAFYNCHSISRKPRRRRRKRRERCRQWQCRCQCRRIRFNETARGDSLRRRLLLRRPRDSSSILPLPFYSPAFYYSPLTFLFHSVYRVSVLFAAVDLHFLLPRILDIIQ